MTAIVILRDGRIVVVEDVSEVDIREYEVRLFVRGGGPDEREFGRRDVVKVELVHD